EEAAVCGLRQRDDPGPRRQPRELLRDQELEVREDRERRGGAGQSKDDGHSQMSPPETPGAHGGRQARRPKGRLTGDQIVTYCAGVEAVFRALAAPPRRRLLDELFKRDGQTLGALERRLPMSRFGVMKHLRVM